MANRRSRILKVRRRALRASLAGAHSITLLLRCGVRAATAARRSRVIAMMVSASCVSDSRRLIGDQCEMSSLSYYLDQHSLFSSAVEFAVENLFPRAEIQFAFGDRNDNFAAHDLTLQVCIGVVFASTVVSIGVRRRMRREFFQPQLIIVMEAWFVVVDERRSSDVHRVDQTKTFHYAASVNEFLDLRCDIDEPASIRHFKPKMFCE